MYLVREMDQLYTKTPISVAQQLEAMIADRGNKMLRYWKEIEKEKSAFEPLYINIPNETLKYRIKNMGEWYIEYACKNKFRFYFFNFIAIIAPLVVTLFNALSLEYGDSSSYSERTVQTIYYRRTRRTISFLYKTWK